MAIAWILVGAAVAWFIFKFRATKSAVKKAAHLEFVEFVGAIDEWNTNRQDQDSLARALRHFDVYDARRADFTRDPTGRTLPADRALLAGYWVQALKDSRLLDMNGLPSRWNEGSHTFWDSVERLRHEHDRQLLQENLGMTETQ